MKILFMCEAVTLSHVARPLELANSLAGFEIVVASTKFPEVLKNEYPHIERLDLRNGVSSQEFEKALARGELPYNETVFKEYLKEDLRVLSLVQPDLVISDFRLTAPISCKLKNIPLITLSNIVWSPYAIQRLQVPENPAVNIVGPQLASLAMNTFPNFFLGKLLKPMNALRVSLGLEPLKSLFEMYTVGDYTAYLDLEEILPHHLLPKNHEIIGPVLFSFKMPKPAWFSQLKDKRTNIFVTMGSSGDASKLQTIVDGLKEMPVRIIVSTLGRKDLKIDHPNVIIEESLPMQEVLRHCDLVISNGGSPVNYLALNAGVPVIGVPYNMDQYLTMASLVGKGCGLLLRSGTLTKKKIASAAQEILANAKYKKAAQQCAQEIQKQNPHTGLLMLIKEALAAKHNKQPHQPEVQI